MILRLAAGLALVIGIGGFGGYLALIGRSPFGSPETRHLRDMKDRAAAPADPRAMTIADFAALPRAAPLAETAAIERRGVVLEGYVQYLLRAPDGDLHLEVAAAPPDAGRREYVTAEITAAFRTGPAWTYEALAWGLRPWRGAAMEPWPGPPPRVRLTGWLLYDFPHRSLLTRDGRPQLRVSAWEIHPVTAIERWDEDSRSWETLAR